jgi:hypothetical protein
MSSDNKKNLDEAMAKWNQEVAAMTKNMLSSGIDWSKANVSPKDVGFKMGPLLTEEQFKAHCQQTGTQPHIFKK